MTTSSLSLSRKLLIGEALKRAAHQYPEKEAFIYGDTRLSYRSLEQRASHIAGWLQERGMKRNEKVGILAKNSLTFVEVFFGIALSGSVGVAINFRLKFAEMEYIINHSDMKLLFVEEEYADLIQSMRDRLPKLEEVIVIGVADQPLKQAILYESIYETAVKYTPCEELSDDDASMIVYTSGTTGKPKGAVLTHRNLCQNSMNMIWEYKLTADFKHLIVPPLYHVGSMSFLVNTCFVRGTSVIHRDFNPENILETIQKEQINSIFLVPAMWNFLFQVPNLEKYDLSSIRKCMTAGEICPLELKRKLLHYFPGVDIYDVFGQTEMSPCTTCLHPEDTLRKTTSVGKPVINVEVRIVDDEMKDVSVGEIGEIVYRGPTLMKEYYKNPEGTKEAFQGGWFHSGDLVRMDEEGFIYVVDRKKDMIISGGENIYPAEIEEVLYRHPSILEAAVIGVPDQTWGEAVKAFVVLKKGMRLREEEVISFCENHLASYKKPKFVEFIDELPRNASGKVMKHVLRNTTKNYQK